MYIKVRYLLYAKHNAGRHTFDRIYRSVQSAEESNIMIEDRIKRHGRYDVEGQVIQFGL